MGTSKNDIRRWFQKGIENNQDSMMVVCDTYDWSDFPVYTKGLEEFTKRYLEIVSKCMNELMEVYDLKISLDFQMSEHRAFHYPEGFEEENNVENI